MKGVKLFGLISAINAEIAGMKAENQARAEDEAPAYNINDFVAKAEEIRALIKKKPKEPKTTYTLPCHYCGKPAKYFLSPARCETCQEGSVLWRKFRDNDAEITWADCAVWLDHSEVYGSGREFIEAIKKDFIRDPNHKVRTK